VRVEVPRDSCLTSEYRFLTIPALLRREFLTRLRSGRVFPLAADPPTFAARFCRDLVADPRGLIRVRLAARCRPEFEVEYGPDPELTVWRFRHGGGEGSCPPGVWF